MQAVSLQTLCIYHYSVTPFIHDISKNAEKLKEYCNTSLSSQINRDFMPQKQQQQRFIDEVQVLTPITLESSQRQLLS